jgi:putative addiction module CopG family antidote
MEISLTPDQEEFVRRAIGVGRFHRADDVVKEALSLWEECERGRAEFLATLDAADALLAEDVKQRGRDRLAAERQKTG